MLNVSLPGIVSLFHALKGRKLTFLCLNEFSFCSVIVLASLPVAEQAKCFVDYAAETAVDELEKYASESEFPSSAEFIREVQQWFSDRPDLSTRSPFILQDPPTLPSIKWPSSTSSRIIVRKNCGADDVSSQEEWVADILEKRAEFVSTRAIQQKHLQDCP